MLPLIHLALPLLLPCSILAATLSPPKLLEQSPDEVWYQIEEHPSPTAKLILKCHASDNAESFTWKKNGEPLEIGDNIQWVRPGQSGSIIILRPNEAHQGYYQCFVKNIFGTAVSNMMHLRLGVLEHFKPRPIRKVTVLEGDSLTLECTPPHGIPAPTIFWLYRDTNQNNVIETIKRRHIAVDEVGRLQFTSVSSHDGRPNLLYECAATSPVLHGEYRAGDRVQLIVLPREGAPTVSVHTLYTSPEEVTVKAGARLKLQCIFGGNPIPLVFWSNLDGDLPKQRMKDLTSADADFGKSLIVENLHPEDAGRYECRAQHLTHVINVRVLAAPYWEIEAPKDVEQSEDSTTELECLANGQPAPLIQWSMNGIPLHELQEDQRRLLLDNGRILRIKDLNQDLDTGVYQCNASNPLGYVYANAFVYVKAHAPRFLMPARREWKVVLRSTVDLSCDVEAAPEPVVRWVDADDKPIKIVSGKTELFPNHTLRISDVNTADEGLYYCNVSNKYGINRASNKLQVFKPTYFLKIPSPKHLTVEAGETVELSCEAVADSRLDIDYRWTINGRPINTTKTFEFVDRKLRLTDVKGRHSGIIDCAAVTDVDVKLASMQLIVKDVPQTPPLVDSVCSERKATLRWKKADPHGDNIRKYTIEMMTDFNKGFWETVYEEAPLDKEEFEAGITLTPWVNYTFRVIAENKYGRNDKRPADIEEGDIRPTAHCQTRPSFPYTNPENVTVRGNQPDNLVVYWTPLEKYYWNAPNLQYQIRYKLNKPHGSWSEFLVEDFLANHTVIREQPTFQEYLVTVRAINAVGPSILEPEPVKGFSGEDVPDYPPEIFEKGDFVNFTALNFSWSAVEQDSVNGHFIGYEIEYWKTGDPKRAKYVSIPANMTSFVVTNLDPHTNYTVVIYTRNEQYRSLPSLEIPFETPEGVPSKVHNMRVFAVGAHAILVQWEKPRQPNGFIRGYFITFENERNETEETYVLHRQTHYLHEKALADHGYKISVWAETKAGEGPKTMRPVRSWPVRKPDRPHFKVHNVTTNSVDIEWIPHNKSLWKMPGSSFYVNYSIAETGHAQQSPAVFLPDTRIHLGGLKEATRYVLIGVARDGKHFSVSDLFYMDTQTSKMVSHLNQDSLRSAAWFIAILFAVGIAFLAILLTCCCQERRSGRYQVRRKEIEIGHQIDTDEERKFLEYQYGYKN